MAGAAVSPLWTAWAAARPDDSNPSPDSRVFASTSRSRAGVTTWVCTATQRLGTVLQQRLVAELRQGQGAPGRGPAAHVRDVARHAGLRLEPRRQGIPHPGHEQPGRRLGDHLGIDQHQVRVLAVEAVLVKNALLGVDDRRGAARGIAGGHGGAIHHGQVEAGGRRPCGVQDLAAAGPDDHLGLVPAGRRP